ncbi:MAG: hypothetical protein M3373_04925 [Gemmatimonadota bacterium]|nr:hypothetical protein [Gemmatimonadota bacterium]
MEPLIPVVLTFWVAVFGGGFYFVRRYVRAVERRTNQDEAVAELLARVASMEEVVDDLRTDVERLVTGQEFTTRLLADRSRSTSSPS